MGRRENNGALQTLELPSGPLDLPVFLPDATRGVVRSVDAADLVTCGIRGLVMNTFHLMQRPGTSTIQALGGLHNMSGWERPIVTDSGGFQAYSLIHENPKNGQITDKGIVFHPEGSERKYQLTPEKTIQLQIAYGGDILICLDDCTHVDAPLEVQQQSVRRTIVWAHRCKAEYLKILDQKGVAPDKRPLLFAVIQGGGYTELRKRCALELLEIGFDGYGYGGWPLDAQGHLLTDLIAFTRGLVPVERPLHALGVGHPMNVAECFGLGYTLFDSALPTRDARHGRLYVFKGEFTSGRDWASSWFSNLYIADDKHIKQAGPICASCDCLCCSRYSLGYLHHLFKIGDSLFFRLATIHNLRFMVRLMRYLGR